jgi:hypothetical protein
MDPDIGVFTLESTGILKRTDPLTIAAAQAAIRFNEYDFHGELYLPNYSALRNSNNRIVCGNIVRFMLMKLVFNIAGRINYRISKPSITYYTSN